ncbi:hypothetical protein ACE6H2_012396 [Prunus campanulata]
MKNLKWRCSGLVRRKVNGSVNLVHVGKSKWIGICVFEVRHISFPYIECASGV